MYIPGKTRHSRRTSRAWQFGQHGQKSEEIHVIIRHFDTLKDHGSYTFSEILIISGQCKNQIPSLANVDVVFGDIVQENQASIRGCCTWSWYRC